MLLASEDWAMIGKIINPPFANEKHWGGVHTKTYRRMISPSNTCISLLLSPLTEIRDLARCVVSLKLTVNTTISMMINPRK